MNTLYLMLFFSFDIDIVNMQEGYVIVGEIENKDQQKWLLKEHITRGEIVYFNKTGKMSLKREARKVEKLSACSTIKLFNTESIRGC
jgi:hypothetical protein